MQDKKQFATLLSVLALIAAGSVDAVSIGAGPSTIDFGKLVKGGYAESQVTVSTSGDEELTCTVEYEGDIKDWLTTDKGNQFTIAPNSRANIKLIVQPPANAANGRYEGALYIKAAPTSTIEGGTGLVVGAGVKIKIVAEISGDEVVSYKLKSASVSNTETGYPIKFTTIIQNTGNVKVKPTVKIDIYDVSGTLKKSQTQSKDDILPTVESTTAIEIPSDGLDVARYTAKITLGNEEQTLTFNILDKGTLALKGVLKTVQLNKIWAEVGETVKISGSVENTGEVLIQGAKLNVEVYMIDERYQTEKLVKTFTSEENLDVPVGQTIDLVAYFTPSTAGRYNIQGTVTYAAKKTPPKTTILNVIERPTNYMPYLIVAAIVVVLFLYWLTKRDEDSKTRRFRKIWGDYLEIK